MDWVLVGLTVAVGIVVYAALLRSGPARVFSAEERRTGFDEPLPAPLDGAGRGVDAALREAGWQVHGPLLREALREFAVAAVGLTQDPVPPDWTGSVRGVLDGHPVDLSLRPGLSPEAAVTVELTVCDLRGVPYVWLDRANHRRLDADRFPAAALRTLTDGEVRRRISTLLELPGAVSLELGADARLCLALTPSAWRELLDRDSSGPGRDYGARAGRQLVEQARLLVRLAQAAEATRGLVGAALPGVRVESRSGERTCPYCRDGVPDDDDARACPACDTRHHTACWEEAGGCTLLGCRGRPSRAARDRA